MATMNEMAYDIANKLEGGRLSDDSIPSLRQIMFNIVFWRATLVRRDINKNNYLSEQYIQDLGILELEKVDKSEYSTLFPTYNYVFRTKNKLPKFLRLLDREAITFVGSVDHERSFQLNNSNRMEFIGLDKFKMTENATYRGDRIYIALDNNCELNYINVRGILADPRKASAYFNLEGHPCYSDDDEFPLPEDMISTITNGLLNGDLRWVKITPTDLENDGIDNSKIDPRIFRTSNRNI